MEPAGPTRTYSTGRRQAIRKGWPKVMRDFKGMKRQRNRGRGGGGSGGGGGGKPQHNANRAFDSNGPDNVKVRGAAQHIYEKYQQLARDAGSAGDRVLAENYLQHAEHYFRVLRAMQPQRPVTEIIGRDSFVSGYDIDFEDETQNVGEEPVEAEAEAGAEGRQNGERWQRDDRPREDRPQGGQQGEYRSRDDRGSQGEYRQRDDRPRDDRPQGERPRDDRPRDEYRDRPREDRPQGEFRPRDDRQSRYPRDDRPRDDRPRDDRPRDDRPREDRQGGARYEGDRQGGGRRDYRQDRPERDPLSVIEPQATPLTAAAPAPAPYEAPESEARVLRGEDGATSHAPAFLQPRAEPRAEAEADGETRRPRRRRAPRSFEAGEAAPAEADEG
jgi:hypothetical protein